MSESFTAVSVGVITTCFPLSAEHQGNVLFSSIVPFFSLLLLIGGSIILTLTYVSWRKYKGTEYKKKKGKRNVND
ncbi:MAG: hypothetical protein GX374_00085 [Bacilli bacterium]|nr:hypothetical protein [Bacilli bacterium]